MEPNFYLEKDFRMIKEININSLTSFTNAIEEYLNIDPNIKWFRGSGNAKEHKLEPSLFRHKKVKNSEIDVVDLEANIKRRFAQTSPPFYEGRIASNDFDAIFMQQHFGVPTRLLDWSENPFIALYFALSSSEKDKDAVVWMLDPIKWNKKSLNNQGLDRIPDTSFENARRFLSNPGGDFAMSDPIAIYGDHINSRITAQRGNFTMFCKSLTPMEDIGYAGDSLIKILIPSSEKDNLYKKMLSIGYTHSVIYPDFSGLSVELKTYFGF